MGAEGSSMCAWPVVSNLDTAAVGERHADLSSTRRSEPRGRQSIGSMLKVARSAFVILPEAFESRSAHVVILSDAACSIVQAQRRLDSIRGSSYRGRRTTTISNNACQCVRANGGKRLLLAVQRRSSLNASGLNADGLSSTHPRQRGSRIERLEADTRRAEGRRWRA